MYVHHTAGMRVAGQPRQPARPGPVAAGSVRAGAVAERAEATRAALITAARRLFFEKGYFATGTEEIVAESGVGTRGALYHHFADKKALFLAVVESIGPEAAKAAQQALSSPTALGRIQEGMIRFLDSQANGEYRQLMYVDGPAVLGWKQWREMQEDFGLAVIRGRLEQAVADGSLAPGPVDALAHLLLAAIHEAALYVAGAADQPLARAEAAEGLTRLFTGLTRTPEPTDH